MSRNVACEDCGGGPLGPLHSCAASASVPHVLAGADSGALAVAVAARAGRPDLAAMRRLDETAQDCAEVAQGLLTVVDYAANLERELTAARAALRAEERIAIRPQRNFWQCSRCWANGDVPAEKYVHKPECNFAALARGGEQYG